ncbi:WecB/TagA/CpsF family glycosyltransferase [Novosphingobium beihaiensis]|uniref:WecB/TagA/CpsF family glycosyltransferase n=1 Tax=Novosphingobium beihaiensis TaxID=2930389 RepID=A0ABT0BV26_9SPHN|nr:WecB/TagA/CpsF family glycosyltransferase [Novosphingobium beihaiensis]MCJ2188857.1 WecB/TagA/CpsF family glycosyltransferase [Novosphingobium beihaiensis]
MFKSFEESALPISSESLLRRPWVRKTFAKTELFGFSLVNAGMADVADAIIADAASGRRQTINFVNAHCVNTARRDSAYAATLHGSSMLLPDGSGMRIAARLADRAMGDNLNGTDLFPELCARAARTGESIYLLGGSPGTAAAAAAEMQRRYPGLNVAGTQHGFFSPSEEAAVIDQINRTRPALLFVGFGVPLQEKWIARNRSVLKAAVVLGVGGLFDYYSGNVQRAPLLLRKAGCEWLWRLMQEPRRLASRYLLGNAVFLAHAARHAVAARGFGDAAYAGAKRIMDFTLALAALLILSPLLLGIVYAIRREDGGPALFRQRRIGNAGKPFTMLKFRSMVTDAEKRRAALLSQSERDSTCFKMKRDPRVTRIGALLRKTSLDELPQLINVLRGEMSIVGPRPALPEEVVSYAGTNWKRLTGKPGITCTWQVSGRAEIPFERQVEMDIDYLGRKSLFNDIMLMLRTVPAVVTSRGAY